VELNYEGMVMLDAEGLAEGGIGEANGGNDLGGMFLTEREVEEATRSLPKRTDWPYIPIDSPPWFGQFH
jgi:hypothetical protein